MNTDANIYINDVGMISPVGNNCAETAQSLFAESINPSEHIIHTSQYSPQRSLPLGLVSSELPQIAQSSERSRNSQLLLAAAEPILGAIEHARQQYGAHRIGVVVGTSTSGIADGEQAIASYVANGQLPPDYRYELQEPFAPARFLAQVCGARGPVWSLSSACTSGGKALVSAARLLRLGVCDAVIAGGADTLCGMTVAGFAALGVVSEQLCQPFTRQRNGINIGEAAALFLMTREPGAVRFAGSGETSDAYHISAPDPSGAGAEQAMRLALAEAALAACDLDYLNFHGTATEQNDKVESHAAVRVLGNAVACGSTKSLTGHTLGAAGALEAAFCWLALQRDDGLLPAHCWAGEPDPELPELPGLQVRQLGAPMTTAMSNSFAFGGNNLSLVLARSA